MEASEIKVAAKLPYLWIPDSMSTADLMSRFLRLKSPNSSIEGLIEAPILFDVAGILHLDTITADSGTEFT